MNDIVQTNTQKDNQISVSIPEKKSDFTNIYNKSYRLAAAVFMISNVIEQSDELKTNIKKLSLNLVSLSVQLKDINFLDARKLILDLEKNSLELMSMLDIAGIAGLVSQMNAGILKEEFESFLKELQLFAEKFEANKAVSVKSIFDEAITVKNYIPSVNDTRTFPTSVPVGNLAMPDPVIRKDMGHNERNNTAHDSKEHIKGYKRKDVRKDTIYEFIKGHNNISIKDIVPNIIGCSEKTVQRELINLINEGKIKKTGERRWSRYSII